MADPASYRPAPGSIPESPGVYRFRDEHGRVVYVGKATKEMTLSKRDLRTRLNEHVTKISGRKNIRLADVACRYLTFESEWWVFAAEYALIVHYKPECTHRF